MKCVVVGGSGFIGSHLVQSLIEKNHKVAVLDLRRPVQDVLWLKKDMRLLNGFPAGTEIVFHLAAIADARRCKENQKACFETNVLGTLQVLKAALKSDVRRVVLASSCWVSGAQVGDVVSEENPFILKHINTVYGASKLSQEQLCHAFLGENKGRPAFTIMRYGIPYGERMWNGLAVRAFLKMAEEEGVIRIMGDGRQKRYYLYVKDLCDAQVAALKPIAENKTYNLTGNKPYPLEEVARTISKCIPSRIDFVPQTRIEPLFKKIDNSLAKRELCWSADTTLEEGMRNCISWWKSLSKKEKREEYWY